ncbi:hypothetical protein J6590_070163 [Homalodisca vitripennis]|nr:hypothetical protein J6590_070163 [Homalodisca vitripennis]
MDTVASGAVVCLKKMVTSEMDNGADSLPGVASAKPPPGAHHAERGGGVLGLRTTRAHMTEHISSGSAASIYTKRSVQRNSDEPARLQSRQKTRCRKSPARNLCPRSSRTNIAVTCQPPRVDRCTVPHRSVVVLPPVAVAGPPETLLKNPNFSFFDCACAKR